jgi:hypothetical protein
MPYAAAGAKQNAPRSRGGEAGVAVRYRSVTGQREQTFRAEILSRHTPMPRLYSKCAIMASERGAQRLFEFT